MSGVGCNDGCFDESVQLATGPQGPAGADGAAGSTEVQAGTDISVTGTGVSGDAYIISFTGTNDEKNVLETGVTQVDVTGNFAASPNPVISKAINGTTENINGVGDIIRLEFFIIGEGGFSASSTTYRYKVDFGGSTVIDTTGTFYRLYKEVDAQNNSAYVTIDLIVSATNTLTPVIHHHATYGDRATKVSMGPFFSDNFDIKQVLPSVSVSDLSASNTLNVSLESSDGTSNISLMSYKIMKFLKA